MVSSLDIETQWLVKEEKNLINNQEFYFVHTSLSTMVEAGMVYMPVIPAHSKQRQEDERQLQFIEIFWKNKGKLEEKKEYEKEEKSWNTGNIKYPIDIKAWNIRERPCLKLMLMLLSILLIFKNVSSELEI